MKGAGIEYDTEAAASWAKKTIGEKIDLIKALDALTEATRPGKWRRPSVGLAS